MARIVRGQFFTLRETEYVEATKALGLSNMRTIFRHILPNSLGPIIVIATAGFANAIIYEAFPTVTHVLAVAADKRRPGYWAGRK